MYRIVLTALSRNTSSQRSYAGKLQVLNGAVWEDVAGAGTVYAHWLLRSKSIDNVPPDEFDASFANLLHDDTVLPSVYMPDAIELDVSSIDNLKLRTAAVMGLHNESTGLNTTATITYTDTHSFTIACTGLSGKYRIALAQKVTTIVSPATLTAGKLTLPGTQLIIGNVRTGVVYTDWTSVQYIDNTTVVDFGSGYANTGDLMYCPAVLMPVHVSAGSTRVVIKAETPAALIIDDGMIDTASVTLVLPGNTQLSIETSADAYSVIIPSTVYPYLTNNGAVQAKGGTGGSGDGTVDAATSLIDTMLLARAGTVVEHRVYAYINGVWVLADPSNPFVATCELWIALGTNAALNGMSSDSLVYDVTWNWATVDGALYLGANGTMTQPVPSVSLNPGEVARIVGHARTASRVRFRGYLPGGRLKTPVS